MVIFKQSAVIGYIIKESGYIIKKERLYYQQRAVILSTKRGSIGYILNKERLWVILYTKSGYIINKEWLYFTANSTYRGDFQSRQIKCSDLPELVGIVQDSCKTM